MEWTRQKPTQAGWFWYFQPTKVQVSKNGGRLECVEVYLGKGGDPKIGCAELGIEDWVGPFETWWYGPFTPPELPKFDDSDKQNGL